MSILQKLHAVNILQHFYNPFHVYQKHSRNKYTFTTILILMPHLTKT